MKEYQHCKKHYKITFVLILACLIPFLTSCARREVVKTEFITPPASLLIQCTQSEFKGETFGELTIYASKLQSELSICASKVDAIINWSNRAKGITK